MKSKLLQGIIKDLMKVPMGGVHAPKPTHGAAEIKIHVAGKPVEGSPEEEAAESPLEEAGEDDAMDGMDAKKKMAMNKAIHAKMKGH